MTRRKEIRKYYNKKYFLVKSTKSKSEIFYSNLWSSSEWGGRNPNLDEQLRLQAILRLIKQTKLSKKIRILDLGCGRGWLTNKLNGYGTVIGIDPIKASINNAKKLYPNLKFCCLTSDQLIALKSKKFDLVVSSEVIEHIPRKNQLKFLKSIHVLLKKNSWAVLTTPRGENWTYFNDSNWRGQPIEEWLTEKQMQVIAKRAGFEVKSQIGAGSLPLKNPKIVNILDNIRGGWRIKKIILPLAKKVQSILLQAKRRVSRSQKTQNTYQVVLLKKNKN